MCTKKTAKGFEKIIVGSVRVIQINTVITKGLEPNDKVALADPTKDDKKKKSATEKQPAKWEIC